MYCAQCGKENPDNALSCSSCGRPLARPGPPAGPPKTSGMAVASLVLGILGLLCGLPAIPGLILGIMALSRINRSAGRLGGSGLAVAGIVVSAAALFIGLLIMPAMLIPALARARMEARKSASRLNLHNIGLCIAMYRSENRHEFPPDLDTVMQHYVGDREALLDPADAEARRLGPKAAPSSYQYVGPIARGVPAEVIICYSRKGLYPDGRNVLCADCVVAWVDEEELRATALDTRRSLRSSYGAVIQASGDRLTEERKAQLKAFYEVP